MFTVVMNELQRLGYLSSLEIESYMPRLGLPFAPKPMLCDLSDAVFVSPEHESVESSSEALESEALESEVPEVVVTLEATRAILPVGSLLDNIFPNEKIIQATLPSVHKTSASLALSTSQEPATPHLIESFSLTIVRPVDGVMIIDSRNTKLALPTELLLRNVLRTIFPSQTLRLNEDVLRWPMIENNFAKRNIDDARTELQTWLSVQHENQPIHFLWLMGINASLYFLPPENILTEYLWRSISLAQFTTKALVLPSLNELLHRPQLKKQLYIALQDYHFSPHE
jgi:hypothetical protein